MVTLKTHTHYIVHKLRARAHKNINEAASFKKIVLFPLDCDRENNKGKEGLFIFLLPHHPLSLRMLIIRNNLLFYPLIRLSLLIYGRRLCDREGSYGGSFSSRSSPESSSPSHQLVTSLPKPPTIQFHFLQRLYPSDLAQSSPF